MCRCWQQSEVHPFLMQSGAESVIYDTPSCSPPRRIGEAKRLILAFITAARYKIVANGNKEAITWKILRLSKSERREQPLSM